MTISVITSYKEYTVIIVRVVIVIAGLGIGRVNVCSNIGQKYCVVVGGGAAGATRDGFMLFCDASCACGLGVMLVITYR